MKRAIARFELQNPSDLDREFCNMETNTLYQGLLGKTITVFNDNSVSVSGWRWWIDKVPAELNSVYGDTVFYRGARPYFLKKEHGGLRLS